MIGNLLIISSLGKMTKVKKSIIQNQMSLLYSLFLRKEKNFILTLFLSLCPMLIVC